VFAAQNPAEFEIEPVGMKSVRVVGRDDRPSRRLVNTAETKRILVTHIVKQRL
jgi:hypothetical protein